MTAGGVLFDIDGVLVTSWAPIPGAAETLRTLSGNRIACAYLTNTTTRTRRQIAAALAGAGMDVRPDEVVTAAVLTAEYVRTQYPGARCLLVNDGDLAYAKIRLDQESLTTALNSLRAFTDSLPRTLVWSAAWDMTPPKPAR